MFLPHVTMLFHYVKWSRWLRIKQLLPCALVFASLVLGFISLSWMTIIIISSHAGVTVLWNNSNLNDGDDALDTSRVSVLNNGSNLPQNKVTNAEPVFPHPYNYMIPNSDFCSRGKDSQSDILLPLLVLVFSAPGNFLRRSAIRQTWGSIGVLSNNTGTVRVGFLLGKTQDSVVQGYIMEEAARYSNIIQEDFLDSYQNLTLKSVMLLKWSATYCPNVRFILKTDDDMFINIPNLLTSVEKQPRKLNVMYGVLYRRCKPYRDISSKWFMPKVQFKGNTYPDFLSGTAYLVSRDIVPRLLEASYSLPFLWLEDVFITGLCAVKAGVKRLAMKGFVPWHRLPTGCSFKDAITGHHVTPIEMLKIWAELQQENLIC